MTKIFWSKDELAALEQEMIVLLRKNPLLRKEQVIEEAQKVFPTNRRRKIYGSMVYRFQDMVAAARKKATTEPQSSPLPPPAQPPVQPDLLRAILEPLLELLADKVAERIQIRAAEANQTIIKKHNPQMQSAERTAKTGVLIVGLLNQQAQTIINLFQNLEITCLTVEEALKREALRRSNTILMTKFINHSVQDKYRKAQNLLLCNGGVSELSAILKNIS